MMTGATHASHRTYRTDSPGRERHTTRYGRGAWMWVVCLLQAGSCLNPADAELIINLDFSNFSTGAPANVGTILGGGSISQAEAVIRSAAQVWETAFANSSSSIAWSTNNGGRLTQNITVGWGAQSGSTLASGGTSWFTSDGRWGQGTVTWDNDGSSRFFVDTTPTESSEWRKFSQRDLAFNGVDMTVDLNFYDAPAGIVRSNADMLTIAIHEIGHTLGFLGSFPAFAASDASSDGDIDITSGPFNGAQIGTSGGHTNFQMQTPSGGDFPYDPDSGSFSPFSYYPNVMGPSVITGTRKLLTEADIAIVAEFLEFDMSKVNFSPQSVTVPDPSAWALLSVAAATAAGVMLVTPRGFQI